MPSQDDIDHQQRLLHEHRATLQHSLEQRAQFSAGYVPAQLARTIAQSRAGIAACKQALRSWQVEVEDLPGDVEVLWLYRREARPIIFVGGLIAIAAALFWAWPRIVQTSALFPTPTSLSTPTPALSAQLSTVTGTAQPSACSQTIHFGEVVPCSLSTAGRDSYVFAAEQDDQVLIVVAEASETTTSSIGQEVSLLLPDGAMLSSCDFPRNSVVETSCRLPQTGRYELRVKSMPTQSSLYRVWIQRLNKPELTRSITLGVEVSGVITQTAQFDTYVIDAPQTMLVSVKIDPNIPGVANKLEPWFAIYDANGDLLPGKCEGESSSEAEGLCDLPAAGRYTMLVAAKRRDSYGAYRAIISKAQ